METSSMMHTKLNKQRLKDSHYNVKHSHSKSKRSIAKTNNHHFRNGHKKDHHNHHQNLAVTHRNKQKSVRLNFYKHGRFNVNRSNGKDNCDVGRVDLGLYSDNNGVTSCETTVKNNEIKSFNESSLYNGGNKDIEALDVASSEGEERDKGDINGPVVNGHHNDIVVGNFTREVYNAICLRLGDTLHIPEASVKEIFNDMKLFPSDTQVTKMLQCARQYSRRNGTNHNYLTFGEFCFFVREMQNHQNPKAQRKPQQQKLNNNKCLNNKCEVFLGGSCNPTTWRADTAIPELQKSGISFYNPQVSIWAPELLAQEHDAKQSASVLLFVIDSQTRSTVGMLEVAYLVACGRCVIVVAQPYRKGQSIMGETITDREYYDLVQGQKSLLDLIKSKGVQIHNNLPTALQCTTEIVRNVSMNGITPEEQVVHKLRRLREVYDSYNGEMRIYDVLDAYRRLTHRSLEISKLYHYLNLQNGNVANFSIAGNGVSTCGNNGVSCSNDTTLSFEKFCAVMAELSTDGCGMCNVEAWASQTFTRNPPTQCSTNPNKANCAFDPSQTVHQNMSNQEPIYDVYLGGSLSTRSKWREEIAIPLLKKHGVRYFNPAVRDQRNFIENQTSQDNRSEDWNDDVSKWRKEIGQCKTALFVITNDTRSLTSMILAAHYIGNGNDVVLSIEQLNPEHCTVANETLTKNAIKDYNRARAYLKDLAERRQIPVFERPEQAVHCVLSKAKSIDESNSRTELKR